MRQLVDETFGEEGGIAVRAAAQMAGGHADLGGVVIDRIMRDAIEGLGARHRISVAHAGQRARRRDRGVAWQQPSGKRRAGRSEEHTSELQSLMRNSYAVF